MKENIHVRNKNVPNPNVPSKSHIRKQTMAGSAGSLLKRLRALPWLLPLLLSLGGTVDIVIRMEPPAGHGVRH